MEGSFFSVLRSAVLLASCVFLFLPALCMSTRLWTTVVNRIKSVLYRKIMMFSKEKKIRFLGNFGKNESAAA